MFGLFKVANVRKEAARKARNWWNFQKLNDLMEESRNCTLCGVQIPVMQGYLFMRREVINNRKFMGDEIQKLIWKGKSKEEAEARVIREVRKHFEDWLVCKSCLQRFL